MYVHSTIVFAHGTEKHNNILIVMQIPIFEIVHPGMHWCIKLPSLHGVNLTVHLNSIILGLAHVPRLLKHCNYGHDLHSSMAIINIVHGGNILNNVRHCIYTLMLALLTIFMTTHCLHSHKQVKRACACIYHTYSMDIPTLG